LQAHQNGAGAAYSLLTTQLTTTQKQHMGNNRHKYFNKVPPFKPDPEHYTRKQHSWKAKEAYETEDDAWEFLQQNPKLKAQGYTVYRCRTCNKWHVGHKINKTNGN
jgi:hypothetical protein